MLNLSKDTCTCKVTPGTFCETCFDNSDSCTKCDTGFTLKDGKCTCKPDSISCDVCTNDPKKCTRCKVGLTLDSVGICHCVPKNTIGCDTCKVSPFVCAVCKTGFKLEEGGACLCDPD